MTKALVASTLFLLAARPAAAQSMQKALESVPGDVAAALILADVRQADADFRWLGRTLGREDDFSAASPLALLKQNLPNREGFDESGSLALAALAAPTLPDLMGNIVVFLPAADPEKLLQSLSGPPGETRKERSVMLFGQTFFAAPAPRHLTLAKSASVARKAAQSAQKLSERMPGHERHSLSDVDAALWLDAAALIELFRPQIDGLIGMSLMMQMGAGDVDEEEARAAKNQMDTFINGFSTLLLAAVVTPAKVGLKVTLSARPESDLARQMQYAPTSQPLLLGLPRRHYLLAFGQKVHPAATKASLGGLQPLFSALRDIEGLDQQRLPDLRQDIESAAEMITALAGTVDQLNAGSNGIVALSSIVETTDASAWRKLIGRIASNFEAMIKPAMEQQGVVSPHWLRITPDAEMLENTPVSQLTFDVPHAAELDQDETELFRTILGDEGLILRIATIDEKRVALTFGGGPGQMSRLIRSARRNGAPLDEETGIARTARLLPAERAGVLYVAVDRWFQFLIGVGQAVDDPFPLWMPQVDAPFGAAMTGGPGWSRTELVAPMELIQGLAEGIAVSNALDDEASEIDEQDDAGEGPINQPDEPRDPDDRR